MTLSVPARSISLLAIAAALACAAATIAAPAMAAPAPPHEAQACFYSRNLSSWSSDGRDVVNLRVGVRDFYQLKLLGTCPDLQFAETIGLETRGGSNFICSGLDVTLIVPTGVTHTVPQRCVGASLRKLSPEEAAALPRKQKP